jgi:2-hydroxychromene-2-carboxylate isomerase
MAAQVPPDFPPLLLSVQRALCALSIDRPEKFIEAVAAMYHAMWADSKPIQQPAVAMEVLSGVIGEQSAKKAFERANDDEVKRMLTRYTDEAFVEGAFGLPWFVGECRYGLDCEIWLSCYHSYKFEWRKAGLLGG